MSKDPKSPALSKLARGFRKRTLVSARLASKTGMKLLRKTLNPHRPGAEVDPERAAEAAVELFKQLSEMKGLIMKLGQMASYLEGALPPSAQEVLARLQSESTPMTFESVRGVLEEDFGAPLDELFTWFEPTPIAAASIGQVHLAEFDGRQLAVKVQYPGIDELFRSDLRTFGTIARASLLFSATQSGELVEELSQRMGEECDYVNEAANQRLFGQLLSRIPNAFVPNVVESRSTRRVLSSDFVVAKSFKEFCRDASQEDKDRAAATIFETCFTCIFRHCIFNADPHPGNYLFTSDNQVCFLDFGCVKRFSLSFLENWRRVAFSIIDGDREGFPDAFRALGCVGRERGFDWDYQWKMMRFMYEPAVAKQPFTFTHEYVKRSYDMYLWGNPNQYKTAIPRDLLFVNRLQWGLYSVLAHLNATGNWRELWRNALQQVAQPVPTPLSAEATPLHV
jgi:predicted unusual protein kinase regulating ubiquinone biosynthesis (AarF/ABC1/UbiB family)